MITYLWILIFLLYIDLYYTIAIFFNLFKYCYDPIIILFGNLLWILERDTNPKPA